MESKVLIIGNGFDLSLGWKTRYSDFFESGIWNLCTDCSPLANFLKQKQRTEKWFDIEQALFEYALPIQKCAMSEAELALVKDIRDKDDKDFKELVQSIYKYLEKEQKEDIDRVSPAARVLKSCILNGYFDKIFTFNYTDLNVVLNQLCLHVDNIYHVHGSLSNDDIILGIDDRCDVKSGYDFLYKTFNKYYNSTPIKYALQNANEVVFFGHSLGNTDYHYFSDFYKDQSRSDMVEKNKKKITIFTYDEKSRMEILRQLRGMNDKSLRYLYSNNDFQIICTDGTNSKDEERLNAFCEHLKECSLEAHNRQLSKVLGYL